MHGFRPKWSKVNSCYCDSRRFAFNLAKLTGGGCCHRCRSTARTYLGVRNSLAGIILGHENVIYIDCGRNCLATQQIEHSGDDLVAVLLREVSRRAQIQAVGFEHFDQTAFNRALTHDNGVSGPFPGFERSGGTLCRVVIDFNANDICIGGNLGQCVADDLEGHILGVLAVQMDDVIVRYWGFQLGLDAFDLPLHTECNRLSRSSF